MVDKMPGISALYPVVAVDQPATTAAAFRHLFPLEPVFETDWYVHLKSSDSRGRVGGSPVRRCHAR